MSTMSTQQSTCFCCWDDLSYGLNTLGPLCLWQCLQNSRSSISCFRIPLFLVIRFIFQFTSKVPKILCVLGLQCLAQVGLLQNFNLILYEDSCAMIHATAAQHVQGQILFLCGKINVPNPARTTVSGCELPHV